MEDYKKQEASIKKRLEKLAKKSGSEIVKEMINEEDPKIKENCSLLSRLFHECIDEYECGEKTIEEAVDEFVSLAKQI